MSFIKAKDLDKMGKQWPNPYGLTKEDAKGKIKDWPLELITLALKEMETQYGKYDLNLLQTHGLSYAFQWDKPKEGIYFWQSIYNTYNGKYDIFYKMYTPEKLKERLEEE